MARSWMKLLDPRLAALHDREGGSLALARALNARARYPEAAEILDRLIAERRCDAEAWFERVLSLGDRFRPEEAGELLHAPLVQPRHGSVCWPGFKTTETLAHVARPALFPKFAVAHDVDTAAFCSRTTPLTAAGRSCSKASRS